MDASKLFVGLLITAVAITQLQGIKMEDLCMIQDARIITALKYSEIINLVQTYQKRCGCSINDTYLLNPILTINGKTASQIITEVHALTNTYLNLKDVKDATVNDKKGLDPIIFWLKEVRYWTEKVMNNIGANGTRTKTQNNFTSIWLVSRLRVLNPGSAKYNDTKIYYTLRELETANINIKRKLDEIKNIENKKKINCTGTNNRDPGSHYSAIMKKGFCLRGVFGKQSNASTLLIRNFGQSNGTSRYFSKTKKNPSNSKPTGRYLRRRPS